jgi:hypothetical protein
MAKKRSTLVVQAKVAGLSRMHDNMGVVFNYAEHRSPFCVWFEVVDEDLAVGDLVTVTIMKSEVQDG